MRGTKRENLCLSRRPLLQRKWSSSLPQNAIKLRRLDALALCEAPSAPDVDAQRLAHKPFNCFRRNCHALIVASSTILSRKTKSYLECRLYLLPETISSLNTFGRINVHPSTPSNHLRFFRKEHSAQRSSNYSCCNLIIPDYTVAWCKRTELRPIFHNQLLLLWKKLAWSSSTACCCCRPC